MVVGEPILSHGNPVSTVSQPKSSLNIPATETMMSTVKKKSYHAIQHSHFGLLVTLGNCIKNKLSLFNIGFDNFLEQPTTNRTEIKFI